MQNQDIVLVRPWLGLKLSASYRKRKHSKLHSKVKVEGDSLSVTQVDSGAMEMG